MDKFPEAFNRFKKVVNIDDIPKYKELKMAFSHWAGEKWIDSPAQNMALKIEAGKHGIPMRGPRERAPYEYKREPCEPYHYHRVDRWQRRAEKAEWRAPVTVSKSKNETWYYERVTVKGKLQSRFRDRKSGCFIKRP